MQRVKTIVIIRKYYITIIGIVKNKKRISHFMS